MLYRGREAQTDPIFDTLLGVMSSDGIQTEIASVGEQISVARGDLRTVTQLSVTDMGYGTSRAGKFYNVATPVPVPAAAWVFGAGLAARGGPARRQRHRPVFWRSPLASAPCQKFRFDIRRGHANI
ncbi:hypothetical protein DKT77_09610 [Meridianimarinicoccus roseus]|uniref:Uncharacterized protein n=1 Tax=Meridianimarinicoccus roseus TaxID=2072018 RepID=A0A2V2LH52_9RHOB|nr:hypothetical protein [Meridianimarinicoccus roseus]PWR02824.1 hypothetical protein DKT77_09610 [Meridianimarinicoccus roseus]